MRVSALLLVVISLIGCNRIVPNTIRPEQILDPASKVILVGVTGPLSVNYIQYCPPICKSYRFEPIGNDVIALPIPDEKKKLELNSYTIAGIPAGYTPQGISVGYNSIDDEEFTFDAPGVYFHLTIDTSNGLPIFTPTEAQLRMALKKYPHLGDLKPINFEWLK